MREHAIPFNERNKNVLSAGILHLTALALLSLALLIFLDFTVIDQMYWVSSTVKPKSSPTIRIKEYHTCLSNHLALHQNPGSYIFSMKNFPELYNGKIPIPQLVWGL